MEIAFGGVSPQLHPDVFVAPGAVVLGRVKAGSGCSFWFNAVLRGDNDNIIIGHRSNIQDNCVLHVDAGVPIRIGDDCVVGHCAVLHGCTLGNRVLIGIGARVLNKVVIEDDVIVAAGAVVPEGVKLQSGYLYMGVPARQVRPLRAHEKERIRLGAEQYVQKAAIYRVQLRG